MADAKNHANTSKFHYNFLYKPVIVTIFLITLPFFSSLAPEFVNRNVNSASFEIVQLIFVGIVVSYGLFSKKSDEKDEEHSLKFDNAQSYMFRLFQVSSVFDDEIESSTVFDDDDDNKVQTWNSQYCRGESVVVVAKDSYGYEQRGTSSRIGEKPLYLPVRSLKSRVCEPETMEMINEFDSQDGFLSRSSSSSSSGSTRFGGLRARSLEGEVEENVADRAGSKGVSRNGNKSRNGRFEGESRLNLEERVDENVIYRSGTEDFSSNGNKSRNGRFGGVSHLNLEEEVEENLVDRAGSKGFSSNGNKSRNRRFGGPSPLNLEEDVVENVVHRASSKGFSSNGYKSKSGRFGGVSPQNLEEDMEENIVDRVSSKGFSSNGNKSRNGRFGDVSPVNLEEEVEEDVVNRSTIQWRSRSGRMEIEEDIDGPSMENSKFSRLQSSSFGSLSSGSSRVDSNSPKLSSLPSLSSESQSKRMEEALRFQKRSPPPPSQAKSVVDVPGSANSGLEWRGGAKIDDSFVEKSDEITKPGKTNESGEDKVEKWSKEMVETFFENRDYTDKMIHEKFPNKPTPKCMDLPQAALREHIEKVLLENDEETDVETEDDYFEEIQGGEEVITPGNEEPGNEPGPDVDKKADEFIAKFREQIRLQRTESIRRRSTSADR